MINWLSIAPTPPIRNRALVRSNQLTRDSYERVDNRMRLIPQVNSPHLHHWRRSVEAPEDDSGPLDFEHRGGKYLHTAARRDQRQRCVQPVRFVGDSEGDAVAAEERCQKVVIPRVSVPRHEHMAFVF